MVKMATGIYIPSYGARDARCRRLLNRHERLEGAWRSMQLTERKRSEIGTFLDSIVLRQVEEDTPGPFLVKIQSGRQTGRCFITSHGRGLREIGISVRLIAYGSKQRRKVGAKRRNNKKNGNRVRNRLVFGLERGVKMSTQSEFSHREIDISLSNLVRETI